MGGLENVPSIEIGERGFFGKLPPKLFDDLGIDFKTEKRKVMFAQERLDFGDGEPVFHDVE